MKSRFICAISYATKDQILSVIGSHSKSINAFAFIRHDKDQDVEPHFHICFKLYSAWSPQQVGKWFALLKDEKGEYINTLPEVLNSPSAYLEYLLHTDPESIKAGKHFYSIDEIFDGGLLRDKDAPDARDSSFEIIEKIIARCPTKQLVRLYGRDFVYHFGAYHEVADQIEREEYRDDQKKKLDQRRWESAKMEEITTSEPLTIFD